MDQKHVDGNEFIVTRECARLQRIQPQSTRKQRARGDGPPHYKMGEGKRARVLYRRSEVLAWIEKHRVADKPDAAGA
jgi:hypothetical protein